MGLVNVWGVHMPPMSICPLYVWMLPISLDPPYVWMPLLYVWMSLLYVWMPPICLETPIYTQLCL